MLMDKSIILTITTLQGLNKQSLGWKNLVHLVGKIPQCEIDYAQFAAAAKTLKAK